MAERLLIAALAVLALVTCGLALWRGDRPTRLFAVLYLVGWACSLVAHRLPAGRGFMLSFAIDAVAVGLMIWISLRWRRLWIAVASAWQLVATLSHLAAARDIGISLYTYRFAQNLWATGVILILLWAALGRGAPSLQRRPAADGPS